MGAGRMAQARAVVTVSRYFRGMTATTDAIGCNDSQELSAKQLRAVDLVALGSTDREAAEAVGCDPSTVWRWRTGSPDFQAALNARRKEVWKTSIDRLRSLLPHALDTVEHALIVDKDARAAFALLRLAGLDAVELDGFGHTDAGMIRAAKERELANREQEAEIQAGHERMVLAMRRASAGLPYQG